MTASISQSKQQLIRLLLLLFLTYSVGFFIMAFLQTPMQMRWYDTLFHSSLTPPPIAFAVVWTILYALIAISTAIVWKKKEIRSIFFTQLLLQVIWSYTFFVAHALWLGFVVLILLCLVVCFMIFVFLRYSKVAGFLLLPYFVWCLFASYLNLITAILN